LDTIQLPSVPMHLDLNGILSSFVWIEVRSMFGPKVFGTASGTVTALGHQLKSWNTVGLGKFCLKVYVPEKCFCSISSQTPCILRATSSRQCGSGPVIL